MRNTIINLVLFSLFVAVLTGIGFAAPAAGAQDPILLKVEFGTKSFTEREYEIVSSQMVKAAAGTMSEVNVGDEKKLGSFKLQVTPTVADDNPNVIVLAYKAWVVRYVTVNGELEKQYVIFADKVSRVLRGTTTSASERREATDVQVSLTPTTPIVPVEIDK